MVLIAAEARETAFQQDIIRPSLSCPHHSRQSDREPFSHAPTRQQRARAKAFLADFPAAMDEAVMNSGQARQNQMMQYLNSKELATGFQRLVFDMLLAASKEKQRPSVIPPAFK